MTILERLERRMLFVVMHEQCVTAANSVAVRDESWQECVLAKVPVLDDAFVGVEVVDVALVALLTSKLMAQVYQGHETVIRSWLKQIAPMAQ